MLAALADAVTVPFDSLGVAGTFTPSGGSGQAVVTVLPFSARTELQLVGELSARKPGWLWWVQKASLPTKPTKGATLVVEGKTYTVQSVDEVAQRTVWQLDCDRTA